MKLGLFVAPLHPPNRSIVESYDRDLDLIVQAERLGYTEAWIGEHITDSWGNIPAAELMIVKALTQTEKIVLGTAVTLLPLHHPIDTAHRIAMLDHMAKGRFYWGIGMRSIPSDLELYGLPSTDMQAARERGREALEVILGIWASEDGQFDYQGKYYQVKAPTRPAETGLRLHYKPYQRPHPPIGVAATTATSDTIRMAGERGWIPMSSNLPMAPTLKAQWEMVEEGAASTGRSADRSQWRITREIYVGETPEAARKEARVVLGKPFEQHQLTAIKALGLLAPLKQGRDIPDDAVNVDYMMENIWIVGDSRECADKIRELHNEMGGFGTLLVAARDPDDYSLMQNTVRLLMEEVIPQIKDLN